MELGSVSVLQDPLLPEKMRAGNAHMASWTLALKTIVGQLQDTDGVYTDREKHDLYDKAMCITMRMDETRALLQTSVQTYGNSTGCPLNTQGHMAVQFCVDFSQSRM